MVPAIRLAILAVAFALITITVGWWAVPVVGVLWGWLAGNGIRYHRIFGAVAAGMAWLAILTAGALRGEGRALVATVFGLFSIPAVVLVTATVGLCVLLGFLGSWLGSGLRPSSNTSPE